MLFYITEFSFTFVLP